MRCLYVIDTQGDDYSQFEEDDFLYRQLTKQFKPEDITVLAKDLANENPDSVIAPCQLHGDYDLVVGHGFAGVFALIIGRSLECRTVLVNPTYPAKHYIPFICPDYQYADLLYSQEFDKFCREESENPPDNVFVILGRDDDIVDTARTDKYFVEGNSMYVSGGHVPDGEDFKMVFDKLIEDLRANPSDLRREIATYKLTGAFDVKDNPTLDAGDQGESDTIEAFKRKRTIVIKGIETKNGNIAIKWTHSDEGLERTLFLYFKDGVWYRDTQSGENCDTDDYSDTITLSRVLGAAAYRLLEQTEPAKHNGTHYWGFELR